MTIRRPFKLAALLAAALLLSTLGWAQTSSHEISLSYGLITTDQIVDIMEDVLTVVITLGTYSKQNIRFTGAPFFTYRYSPTRRFSVGLALGTYSSKGDLYLLDTLRGTYKENSYVGAAEISFRWVAGRAVQIYSGLGAGATIKRGTYNVEGSPQEITSRVRPTFHVNALGLRLGGSFAFFGEVGAGYKGIVNIGLSGRF